MERYLEIKAAEPCKVEDLLLIQAKLTRKQISQAKFRTGGICKNGKQCRVTERAVSGDVIRVCLEMKETDSRQLESPSEKSSDFSENLQILYEDQDILAVNKPAGVVTHPSGSHYRDSLSNQIAAYFRSKGEATRIRSIGRLDRETSGILLFARNQVAAARLQKQREEGRLQKTYLAIVEGKFPENGIRKIEIPIAPDPDDPVKMVISPDGTLPGSKNAVTYCKVVKNYPNKSLIQLHLETGRTHQIRVHMAGLGHPLLGDTLYNEKRNQELFKRAALHAWKLVFYHPFSDEKIVLEAPFPTDFCLFCYH